MALSDSEALSQLFSSADSFNDAALSDSEDDVPLSQLLASADSLNDAPPPPRTYRASPGGPIVQAIDADYRAGLVVREMTSAEWTRVRKRLVKKRKARRVSAPPPVVRKRKLGELSGAVSEDVTHCPVCMDWHRGDIFQCPEGHLLCGPCKAGLQRDVCPSCRAPLGSLRNRAVESMLGSVVMPCRWHEVGSAVTGASCAVTGTRAERSSHEEDCKFKRHTCPEKNCSHSCSADKMVDHYVDTQLDGRSTRELDGRSKHYAQLESIGPWVDQDGGGAYKLLFQRKKRSLFAIYLETRAGRLLLKVRTLFDLDGHNYLRVSLAVHNNAEGVSVPLPLAQTDEWDRNISTIDASIFSFPLSIFAHVDRSEENIAGGRFLYAVSVLG